MTTNTIRDSQDALAIMMDRVRALRVTLDLTIHALRNQDPHVESPLDAEFVNSITGWNNAVADFNYALVQILEKLAEEDGSDAEEE